jgi:hypothetical protein
MLAKSVAVAVSTALVILLSAACLLFLLMIGMNGVQERKATPIFIGYFVLTTIVLIFPGC